METRSKISTLFLGDLSIFCTVADLMVLFSPFGQIEMLEIKVDPATQRSLNYGFIKFLHHESAAGALAQVNGTIIHGRPLRLENLLFFQFL